MKKKIFIAAAVFISAAAQAQDTTKTLSEVVVTTSKFPKKQTETGKVVTVISKETIEKNAGKSISELLQMQAGVTIAGANNNAGTNQTVSIRGGSAGNTLILIDGIPANDPSVITNYFDLNFISTDNIERIEILKGGQSTLYGSDAVAGAVNIITKKGADKKIELTAGAAAGSFNTFKQQIGISGKTTFGYTLNYTHINSDGFSSAHDKTGNKNFDNDGINQHAVNGALSYKLSNNTNLKLFSSYSYYKTGLDAGAFADEKDYNVKTNNAQAGVGLIHQQQKTKGTLYFNYAFNYNERNYKDDSVYKVAGSFTDFSVSNYTGRSHFAELYDSWKWSKWEYLLGIDYRLHNTTQDYYSTGPFGDYATSLPTKKMSQASPYTSLVYKAANGFTVEGGLRLNIHSAYGSNMSFTFNPSYLVKEKVKLFANVYSAFKTPTLYQLYEPSFGNADLKPESSVVAETGVQLLNNNGFTSRLTGFYRNTKNKIDFIITNLITYASQYQNISRQKNYGAELELGYSHNNFSVNANYTYTDGKSTSAYDETGVQLAKDTTFFNLYRIPKHTINISAGYDITNAFYIGAAVRSVSKRLEYIYAAAPEELKAYMVADITAQYKTGKWKFFADVKNVLNKQYFDILGYNSKKLNVLAGLVFKL